MRPLLRPLIVAALLVLPAAASAQVVTRNFDLKAHFDDYALPAGYGYSSCWSYVHGDGREYAVIGTNKGTAIYNVTDPDNAYFVEYIQGIASIWREMKSYRNWIYVVTEGYKPASGDPIVAPGIQIISMVDPENPVLASTWAGSFNRAHSVSVDTTRGLLICNGTNLYVPPNAQTQMGMRILSLVDPVNPVEVGWWPGGAVPISASDYVHDSVPIGNRLYASSIYPGIQRILDFTNPAAPIQLTAWTYDGAFSHNAWPDATGNYLYVTDEVNGEPLKVFDITGLPPNPPLVGTLSANPKAIVHNAHVRGNVLFLANYTEGVRALDISDPVHPAEFGFADSYAGGSGGFSGVWGVCPYFPSGTVIASDMQTGLYVYRPQTDYGIVHVKVTDGGSPLAGAKVYVTTRTDSATTSTDGIVRFAPNAGSHTIKAVLFGYTDASVTLPVGVATLDSVTLVLNLRPNASLSGYILDRGSLAPLEGAEIDLRYTPIHQHTHAGGHYMLTDVPADDYRVEVRRPGYIPVTFDRNIHPGEGLMNFQITATATWDPLDGPSGWTVGAPGDNATTGTWTRVVPLGTSTTATAGGTAVATRVAERGRFDRVAGIEHQGHEADGASPGQVAPAEDRSPAPGTSCFVTGQGNEPSQIDQADVDGGRTTLTSPALNVTGMSDPVIGYWRWFYSQFGHVDDWLAVSISNDNGGSWTPVDTTRALGNHWVERSIRVLDYLTPTSQVRLRFAANDGGDFTVVEAGIDDLVTYDLASLVDAGPQTPARLALRSIGPNPSRAGAAFSLETPTARDAEVAVYDVSGRRVRMLWRGHAVAGTLRLAWDGQTDAGHAAPAGLYFARVVAGGAVAETRIVRID